MSGVSAGSEQLPLGVPGGSERDITLFIGSLRGGGAESVCVTIANGLSERGWRVTVLVLNLDGAHFHNGLRPGITLVNLDRRHARDAAFALAAHLRRTRPPRILVFNHQLAAMLVLLRWLRLTDARIVARNINTLSRAQHWQRGIWHGRLVPWLVRRFYGGVDAIVAQSRGMRDDLVAHFGLHGVPITVIHNPVRREFQAAAHLGSPRAKAEPPFLLCVARLEVQKALDEAIRAVAALAPDYPTLRLKIVGKGSLEADLRDMAHTAGIADRVDFEGFQGDLRPYYSAATVTVLTSRYEGFPNVLLESIACGTPVVAYDCPSGPAEIIVEGVNGYLVPLGDLDALVDRLRACLEGRIAAGVTLDPRYFDAAVLEQYEAVLR